jgi:hypothetical protein
VVLLGPVGNDCTGQIRENLRGSVQVPQFAGFFNKALDGGEGDGYIFGHKAIENSIVEEVYSTALKRPRKDLSLAKKIGLLD